MKSIVLWLAVALYCGVVQAQVPHKISYQGRLTDPGGASPVTATVSMTFRLYTVASGPDAAIYTESQDVTPVNGVFNVTIGSVTPIPASVPFDRPYYLGVTVGNDAEMTPRQLLAASPYALRADSAASADALAPGATVQASQVVGSAPPLHIAAPRPNTATPIDMGSPSVAVGMQPSLTIGPDGLPVMSYHDLTNQKLKVARCATPDCSTVASIVSVDPASNVGQRSAIAIGVNGLPVIAYFNAAGTTLKVASCGDPGCTTGNTIRAVFTSIVSGSRASISIGADGFPMLTYTDSNSVNFVKCGDATCTAASASRTDQSGGLGTLTHSVVALGGDGLPAIAVIMDAVPLILHCGDALCTTSGRTYSPLLTLATTDAIAMTVGIDGLPVLAFHYVGALKVARCLSSDCGSTTIATIAYRELTDVGLLPSIAIGTSGLPILSYYDAADGSLKVANCSDPSCSSVTAVRLVASGVDTTNSSIAAGADGLPLVAYRVLDASNGGLKVTKCGSTSCTPYLRRR